MNLGVHGVSFFFLTEICSYVSNLPCLAHLDLSQVVQLLGRPGRKELGSCLCGGERLCGVSTPPSTSHAANPGYFLSRPTQRLTHAMAPRLGGEFRELGGRLVEIFQRAEAGSRDRGRRLQELGPVGQQAVPCVAWCVSVYWA